MNKFPKKYHRVVGVRLSETDTTNLDRICAALGVTRSEFVRRKIENINKIIMSKDILNIKEGPATDAWGRDIAKLQSEKEQNEKQVMNAVEAMKEPPAELQPKEVKKTSPKPATTIFNVKGISGHFKSGFSLYIQSATKEKAIEKSKSIRFVPGSSVTVTSITPVSTDAAKGKKIIKA